MEMRHKYKTFLINGAIVFALAIEFWRGRMLGVLIISAVVLFIVANLGLLRAAKKGRGHGCKMDGKP
jgi:hypothetical protein